MTFVISHGVMCQKDLGADTAKFAAAMEEYNQDNTWTEVKDDDTYPVLNREVVKPVITFFCVSTFAWY